jgi:integrase
LPRRKLIDACAGWLLYGDLEGWSQRTIGDRREWLTRLHDFFATRELDFDTNGLRAFFLALQKGDPTARCHKPLKPGSVKHAHTMLKALSAWLVEEGFITENPMRRVPAPILRDDGIDAYADEDLTRILAAARLTRNVTRDYAIVSMLAYTRLRRIIYGVRSVAWCAPFLMRVNTRRVYGPLRLRRAVSYRGSLVRQDYFRLVTRVECG